MKHELYYLFSDWGRGMASNISRKGATAAWPVDRVAAPMRLRRLQIMTEETPTATTAALLVQRSSDFQSGSTMLF